MALLLALIYFLLSTLISHNLIIQKIILVMMNYTSPADSCFNHSLMRSFFFPIKCLLLIRLNCWKRTIDIVRLLMVPLENNGLLRSPGDPSVIGMSSYAGNRRGPTYIRIQFCGSLVPNTRLLASPGNNHYEMTKT